MSDAFHMLSIYNLKIYSKNGILLKLSKRLKSLEQMVGTNYDHIWDCCCDHGLLGASILSKHIAKTIHFVDIVPELIDQIEHKLQQFHAKSQTNWKVHCLDAAELPLKYFDGKHLIIISGIGGDLMSRMIQNIHRINPELNADFLLCPVYRQFALREQLIELNLGLKNEILVEDKKRFYEVMLVTSDKDEKQPINPVGEKIWQSNNDIQIRTADKYLENTLSYYQRIQQGNKSANVDHIIDAYKAVILTNDI